MDLPTKDEIIRLFDMKPLEGEGGMWCQTYISDETIPASVLPGRSGDRKAGTGILFLLTKETFSRMHRLTSDEIYHFYLGSSVELLELFPDGTGKKVRLGQDIMHGDVLTATVRRGVWQGSHLAGPGEYALLGTTMCPGYDPADYTDGYYRELAGKYPDFSGELKLLCGEARYS